MLSVNQSLDRLTLLIAAGAAGLLAGAFNVRVVYNLVAIVVILGALFALWRLPTTQTAEKHEPASQIKQV